MHESLFYKKLSDKKVRCNLCPHYCVLHDGETAICKARKNINGTLYSINYGECTSLAMDPIEKKPLYHFYPETTILSTAPNSCNVQCPWCQNAEISQEKSSTRFISPEDLVKIAIKNNSFGIAYTYTEPLTWYEYLMDTAIIAHKNGLKNVLVTNGMINKEPLMQLLPWIDAANIDLKSMKEKVYREIIKGDLKTVLQTIKIAKKHIHIEVTSLLIPGLNDSSEEIEELVEFVETLSKETPLHFSRYFPHYHWTAPPTPIETLKRAYEIAKKKLLYVYVGNAQIENTSNTFCPQCGHLLVERTYFSARLVGIKDGRCSKCGRKVDIEM
jgi:pyruvate formate lyase activating enzyme